jgi:hypothetical protein
MFAESLGSQGFKPDGSRSMLAQSTNQAKAMFGNQQIGSTTSQPQFNGNGFALGNGQQQQGGYWNSSFSPNPNPFSGESQNAFMSGNLPVTTANCQCWNLPGRTCQYCFKKSNASSLNGMNVNAQGRYLDEKLGALPGGAEKFWAGEKPRKNSGTFGFCNNSNNQNSGSFGFQSNIPNASIQPKTSIQQAKNIIQAQTSIQETSNAFTQPQAPALAGIQQPLNPFSLNQT